MGSHFFCIQVYFSTCPHKIVFTPLSGQQVMTIYICIYIFILYHMGILSYNQLMFFLTS